MCSIIHKYILRNQPGTSRPELTAMIIAVQQYHGTEALGGIETVECTRLFHCQQQFIHSLPYAGLGHGTNGPIRRRMLDVT